MKFEQQYLCMPEPISPEEIRLRLLAGRYHETCEEYDRSICTGPIVRGSVMPATGDQILQINTHARKVRDRLFGEVRSLGFSKKQWNDAIRTASKYSFTS